MRKQQFLALLIVGTGLILAACGSSTRAADYDEIFPTPTSRPGSVTIHLSPEGSSDHPSLAAALTAGPEGATFILEAGAYYLPESLTISKPVRLVGAGMDRTEIVSEAKEYVVRFSGTGPFAAEDLTFRHRGEAAADVVVVADGAVTLTRCRFTGAVYRPGRPSGAGLRLQGKATGEVQGCAAVKNGTIGIVIAGQAHPTLAGNTSDQNASTGIAYQDKAGGVARQNQCMNNGLSGISVDGQAEPLLTGNLCFGNKVSGIAYLAMTGGLAQQNECRGGLIGISVDEQADPGWKKTTVIIIRSSVFFSGSRPVAPPAETVAQKIRWVSVFLARLSPNWRKIAVPTTNWPVLIMVPMPVGWPAKTNVPITGSMVLP